MMHILTRDRRKWAIAALLAGIVLSLAHLAAPYVWLRVPRAVVSLHGKAAARASVYQSLDGRLLVSIDGPDGAASYIVDRAEGEVFMPCCQSLLDDVPETNHFLVTASFAWVMDDHHRPRIGRHYDDALPGGYTEIQPGGVEFAEAYLTPQSASRPSPQVRVRW